MNIIKYNSRYGNPEGGYPSSLSSSSISGLQLDLINCDILDIGYAGHGMYSSCGGDIGFDVAIAEWWDLKRSAECSTVARPMPCSLARRSAVSVGEIIS